MDQSGIRLINMNIIEITKQDSSTIWHDGKTFLVVFDENNNQIADYDFSTGLQILQDEDSITIFITDEDIVPGSWKFFGTKIISINDKIYEEKVFCSGESFGSYRKRSFSEKDPWNKRRVFGEYVSFSEREERMDICRSCPLFNKTDGTCSVNGNLVIETTKNKYSFCPEEKWGNKEEVVNKMSLSPEGDIITPEPIIIDEKDQEKFEDELEEYLRGL